MIFPASDTTPLPTVDAGRVSDKTYAWRSHVCDMASTNTAANREWILTTLNGHPIHATRPPSMKFAGGTLSVFGGINRLSGSYALVRDAVVMGDLASTLMAGPPELMELEREFAQTLASVDTFHVHGESLDLMSQGNVVATFRAGQ